MTTLMVMVNLGCMKYFALCLLFLSGCVAAPPPSDANQSLTVAEIAQNHPGLAETPPGEARLHEIRNGVWVHVAVREVGGVMYPANGLVVRDGNELILVDTAWGDKNTEALLTALKTEIGLPVRSAIAMHFHDDCVEGMDVLDAAGVATYGTPLTKRLAKAEGNQIPRQSIDGLAEPGDAVRFGPMEIFYPGPAHSVDNLVVYVPDSGVLFGGCAVYEMDRKTPGYIGDADLLAWSSSMQRLKTKYPQTKIVVPGHGLPGGLELLDHTSDVVNSHRDSALER
nr:subclass B1 metallo-beta-lactamase [Mucisphaera calidilacus]